MPKAKTKRKSEPKTVKEVRNTLGKKLRRKTQRK